MKKDHIYISYTNTGAGHSIPALAIAEYIETLYPRKYQITTSNFFYDAGEKQFNTFIENSWNYMLKLPILTKILIGIGNVLYRLTPYYIPIIHKNVWKRSMEHIKKINPDIVFTTHFFTHTIALDARKRFNLKYPIVALNPDTFETFPQWDRRGDVFLVCSQQAAESAYKFGHHPDKVIQVPQVLRKEFEQVISANKEILKQEYGIRKGVFTILMSDGGQGVGKMYQSLKKITKMKLPINIITVCGKNEKLYKKLLALQEKFKEKNHSIQLTVFSFVESMASLIHISDLFIGKSGPATVLECLKKELPVVVNFFANTAEKKTAQFFKKKEVVYCCNNLYQLPKLITQIIDHPEQLKVMQTNLNQLNLFQNGSDSIIKIIIDCLENHKQNMNNDNLKTLS